MARCFCQRLKLVGVIQWRFNQSIHQACLSLLSFASGDMITVLPSTRLIMRRPN
ncbi:Uncharacterised protein [Vibrio cholerae]|nr:Uncharacterised protein [Vibrio cholerae]CSB93238.1 Uncharacterised protein [Vibrio cholerae]CSD25840.1 Uncharacterised protein [Vibrio cholerae]